MQEPAPSLSRSADTGIGEELYRLAAEIFPIRVNGQRPKTTRAAPRVGEHSAAIRAEFGL